MLTLEAVDDMAEDIRDDLIAAGYSKRTPGGEVGVDSDPRLAVVMRVFDEAHPEQFRQSAANILRALDGAALSTRPAGESAGVADIAAERARQIAVEGWTPAHDDEHGWGQIALAAASYAIGSRWNEGHKTESAPPTIWPWENAWWKPAPARRMLVKAGALIIAEIERLDRLAARASQPSAGEVKS